MNRPGICHGWHDSRGESFQTVGEWMPDSRFTLAPLAVKPVGRGTVFLGSLSQWHPRGSPPHPSLTDICHERACYTLLTPAAVRRVLGVLPVSLDARSSIIVALPGDTTDRYRAWRCWATAIPISGRIAGRAAFGHGAKGRMTDVRGPAELDVGRIGNPSRKTRTDWQSVQEDKDRLAIRPGKQGRIANPSYDDSGT